MADNTDQGQWLIEWTYSPTDFFERPRRIRHEHCELTIKEGKVDARIDPAYGDPRPTLRNQLDTYLNNLFIGAQLESAKRFELSPSSVYCEKPGGGRDPSVEVSELTGTPDDRGDIRIVDKDGTVIADIRLMRACHSCLNATIGSIRAARRAGSHAASSATNSRTRDTLTNVRGSVGLTA